MARGKRWVARIPTLAMWLAAGPGVAADCSPPRVVSPGMGETVASGRPAVRWQGGREVSSYKLMLLARKPEGEVVASFDTLVTGTEFVPPYPLARSTATVTVSVSAVCEDAQVPAAPPALHRFYIDLRPGCRLVGAPVVRHENQQRWLDWSKAAHADRYDVFAYRAFDGQLLFSREVASPPMLLPAVADVPVAIAVRPRCGAVEGQAAHVLR